jgi:aminoglycoside phosphotransferase (APT) family kinase protein
MNPRPEGNAAMWGDPLWAVLIPPRLIRFRELVEIDDEQLDVDVTGWNKFVLLSADRVYLFPREAKGVEWFVRELAAYRVLEPIGLTAVPRLLGEWQDETVYPYPFAAVSRLPGTHPADSARDLFEQLYRSVAQWHDIVPPELPDSRPPAHHDHPDIRWLRRALDPSTTREAVAEAADRLGCAGRVEQWSDRLEAAAQYPHVLVHGDLHEDQLLVVDGRLTGILDWETARIDHPFWDFDLSEWGTELWRRHRHDFSRLWSVAWRSYASERGLDLDPSPLETAFRLRHALFVLDTGRDPSIAGTIAEHLAAI